MLIDDTFATTFLDQESVSQSSLDIVNRVRTNLLPWAGQFSPQLVEELLTAYGQRAETIMDPFVGSGTSLVEAARLGKSTLGSDINPAAAILSRVYQLINLNMGDREAALRLLSDRLSQVVASPHGALPSEHDAVVCSQAAQEYNLVRLCSDSDPGVDRILTEALVVLCDFYREGLNSDRIYKTWNRLAKTVRSLPESDQTIAVHQADARALPTITDSVDLVLTSPPYINVHNYHQKFRRSVEALGWNVLTIASSEIGSNRQNRGNRFLTVIQYALDMVLALREMARVARPGSRLILVVGRESSVRRIPFFNGKLVAELAVNGVGLKSERRQERQFINRYGSKIREDILHFRTYLDLHDEGYCLTAARTIAGQTLSTTRQLTDRETRQGIDDALERIDLVQPSPLPNEKCFSQVFA